ncbi:MAG: hypothetical protein KDA65_08570 [Planctomycetaceae bacterium]|nr:hypothetical protein [Planctomycetaceae bacterium]
MTIPSHFSGIIANVIAKNLGKQRIDLTGDDLHQIEELDLSEINSLADISSLALLPNLKRLHLFESEQVTDLSVLGALHQLEELYLSWYDPFNNLSLLTSMPKLRVLELFDTDFFSDLSPLLELHQLKGLHFRWHERMTDLSPLLLMDQLEHLSIDCLDPFPHWPTLRKLPSLKELSLNEDPKPFDFTRLQGIISLEKLDVICVSELKTCEFLKTITSLRHLSAKSVTETEWLGELTFLESLELSTFSETGYNIAALANLESLEFLELTINFPHCSLQPLSSLRRLQTLLLWWNGEVIDASFLDELTSLTQLTLKNFSRLDSLNIPPQVQRMELISSLVPTEAADDNAPVTGSNKQSLPTTLNNLHIGGHLPSRLANCIVKPNSNLVVTCYNSKSLPQLKDSDLIRNIQHISVGMVSRNEYIELLDDLEGLLSLSISHGAPSDILETISHASQLRSLDINGFEGTNLNFLHRFSGLEHLEFTFSPDLTDLDGISSLSEITELFLYGNDALTELTPISSLDQLLTLDLSYCDNLRELTATSKLSSLEALLLNSCHLVCDLRPLACLQNLTYLNLCECISLTDLSPLAHIPNLKYLDLTRYSEIRDIAPLLELKKLTTVRYDEGSLSSVQEKMLETHLISNRQRLLKVAMSTA